MTDNDRKHLIKTPYRSLVGKLMYIAIGTRPDITFTVQQLCKFLDNYSDVHWEAAKCVVCYLKGTCELKLILGVPDPTCLVGYTDSDFANCVDTHRSISSCCFNLGSGSISWCTRQQKTVSLSMSEAEFIAACEATQETVWLCALLLGLDFRQDSPTHLNCDNSRSIVLSEDPSFHARVKHIDIKYHYICDRVHEKQLCLHYVQSKSNTADILTKALPKKDFLRLRNTLGLC